MTTHINYLCCRAVIPSENCCCHYFLNFILCFRILENTDISFLPWTSIAPLQKVKTMWALFFWKLYLNVCGYVSDKRKHKRPEPALAITRFTHELYTHELQTRELFSNCLNLLLCLTTLVFFYVNLINTHIHQLTRPCHEHWLTCLHWLCFVADDFITSLWHQPRPWRPCFPAWRHQTSPTCMLDAWMDG